MAKKQSAEATATSNTTANAIQKIRTTITSISFIPESNNYIVDFGDSFDAIIKDGESYIEGKSNKISFNAKYLKYLLFQQVPDLALLYEDAREKAQIRDEQFVFTASKLNKYLAGATIVITRTKFNAGDEYTDVNGETFQHQNSGYDTVINEIRLSAKGQSRIDKDVDAI